jgi:hypothetical protein
MQMTYSVFLVIVQDPPSGETQVFTFKDETMARVIYESLEDDNDVELVAIHREGKGADGLIYLARNFMA